jgi:hypothetical protein
MISSANDGSKRPPRLVIYGNQWGLSQLPQRPAAVDWSLDETLDRLTEAGFDGFQGEAANARAVRARGLRFASSARINLPADAAATFARVADAGADCITIHAGWGMESDAEMDALADAITAAADEHHLPAYLETHRATLTQDIYRTCRLIERRPHLRFNADLSHCYCGHELGYRGFEVARHYVDPILDRTCFLHGRVSDGECMQIDLADPHYARHVTNFRWWWTQGMSRWLKTAGPGDILPFVPELGPAASGYSITIADAGGVRREIADRWQGTLLLKQWAEECFEAASAMSGDPAGTAAAATA